MLNFEEFCREAERYIEELNERFVLPMLHIQERQKAGELGNQMMILQTSEEQTICPGVSFFQMYRSYQKNDSVPQTVNGYVAHLMNAELPQISQIRIPDRAEILQNVMPALIQTKGNEEFLSDCPHRPLHDLSIYYRVDIALSNGDGSIVITNGMISRNQVTEEELYQHAKINIQQNVSVRSVEEITLEHLGMPELIADEPRIPMYVITSDTFRGASAAVLTDSVEKLAEQYGQDMLLLPSSVYEMLAAPVGYLTPEEAAVMVDAANMTTVEPEERLSGSIYRYNRETKEIQMAYEAPTVSREPINEDSEAIELTGPSITNTGKQPPKHSR